MCIRDNDFIQHKHVIHSHHMQNKATAAKGSKGMRWHPLMIKWCLYLKSLSTAAYETLRDVIRLPSTRTLLDYTHWMTAQPGSFIGKSWVASLRRIVENDSTGEKSDTSFD